MLHASKQDILKIIKIHNLLVLSIALFTSCGNNNEILVNTNNDLQVENVEIKYGFTSINRENDSELFNSNLKTVFDGKYKNNLSTIFGENDFLIIYDDKFYYSFRHFIFTDFKSSSPKGHEYNFSLYKRNDTILCDVDIIGEEPMKFTRFMSEIKTAKNKLGNTPIEKAGTIYNMKEMEEEKQ